MNGDSPAEARRRAAVELLESHDAVLRRAARRYSLCGDDADDAYQRALEILLTKAPSIDGEALLRWMQTVTKREAWAVRRQRERLLSGAPRPAEGEDHDPIDLVPSDGPGPTDRAARRERVVRSGEALRALKPQEVRALTLKAQGYSYAEIGEITGWTYTKINRCMAEGRKRFLEVFAEIETGERCAVYAADLSALADGELNGDGRDLRVHLRSCPRCRAMLRLYRGLPIRVLSFVGPVGVAADPSFVERAQHWGGKLGATLDRGREAVVGLLNRGAGEAATQVAAGGGTRGAGMVGLAKLLAVCGATAAGSATCVATGIVDPATVGLGADQAPAPIERPAKPVEDVLDRDPIRPPTAVEDTAVTPAPAPAPAPTPAETAEDQFGFESSAPSATGGGGTEFGLGGGGSGGGGSGGGGGGEFGFQQ